MRAMKKIINIKTIKKYNDNFPTYYNDQFNDLYNLFV